MLGGIQVLRNADGGRGGVSHFPGESVTPLRYYLRYEGVRFNVISVTRGWVARGGPIS